MSMVACLELPPHMDINCTATFMHLLKSYFFSAVLTLFFLFIIRVLHCQLDWYSRPDTQPFLLCVAVVRCLFDSGWVVNNNNNNNNGFV